MQHVYLRLSVLVKDNVAVLFPLVLILILVFVPLKSVDLGSSAVGLPKGHSHYLFEQKYDSSVYSKRATEDKDWNKCLDTGDKLLSTIQCQQQSPSGFEDYDQLQRDGWGFKPPPDSHIDGDLGNRSSELQRSLPNCIQPHLAQSYNFLGTDGKDGFWNTQNSWKDINGNNCKMTIDTNAQDGTIVVTRSYGPKTPEQGKLTRLSDIALLLFKKHAEEANVAPKFNYYIVMSVSSRATQARVREIMGKLTVEQKLKTTGKAPGLVFNTDGPKSHSGSSEPDEGTFARVLLGSPTGIASAWILVNRQHLFPGRTVKSVGIFQSDYDEDEDNDGLELFDMVYTIGDSD